MEKSCEKCGGPYLVDERDLVFYDSVSPLVAGKKFPIPSPSLCPQCRLQRRYSWRNERTLYVRKCDGTGENILSVFSPEKPFKVYQSEYWYSDAWDAKSFGRDFDFNRPFFEQFQELMQSVPQLALSVTNNQNCDYVNQTGYCKDCYLIFEADFNEGCLYGNYIQRSRDCVDCTKLFSSELCYECFNCENSYNLRYSQDCTSCSDSWFLKNCVSCQNCFGSVNLRNKQYYFYNQALTKEQYLEALAKVDFSRKGLTQLKAHFEQYVLSFPVKFMHGTLNQDSTGDYLSNTKDCHDSYELMNSQDCRFVVNCRNMKNVYDVLVFGSEKGAEFSYESHEIGEGVRNICFSDQIWNGGYEIYYSKLCLNDSHDLFGCVGLRRSSHCILNKQYSKEDYEILVQKIIEHMMKTGEWGQFFPAYLSPFAYNETLAQDFYPLEQDAALSKGFQWKTPEVKNYQVQSTPAPEEIAKTPDSILNEIMACETCGKNYKLVAQELLFYRKMQVPVPVECEGCRHQKRAQFRNPRQLWTRPCDSCGQTMQSSYAPTRPEKVLCEVCYLNAVC
jgi:hypothetical protein